MLVIEPLVDNNGNSGVPLNARVFALRARRMTMFKAAPAQTEQMSPPVGEALLARKGRSPTSSRRVLLVDDDSDVLVSIGGWIEAANMDVVRASSGKQALNLLLEASGAIDAVVTDIMMPGMSGVEFLASARRIRRTLPALVITGYAGFDGANELPSDVAVMLKPFRRKEFISRVQSLLNVSELKSAERQW